MKIRKIRENELAELTRLYRFYADPESLPPLSTRKMNKIWKAIRSNPMVNYFVLETKGKIVATCILSITPSFIRGGTGYGLIEHVVTHQEHRRKGYMSKLLRYALAFAWKHGCTEVMLTSGVDARNAHQMYETLGFDKHKRHGFIIFKPNSDRTR